MITSEAQRKGAEANRQKALDRDALVLGLLEDGWPYVRIARELGIKVSTVPTVILRARRRAGIGPTR